MYINFDFKSNKNFLIYQVENGQFHNKAAKDCIAFVNKKPLLRIFHSYKAYFVHKRDSQITRSRIMSTENLQIMPNFTL